MTLAAASGFASDKRDAQAAELERIKEELKPLRQRAYLEADVIAAKRRLDDAYRSYWAVVRDAMARLEPDQKALIEREIALRKEMGAISGGSRAEDYERRAAAQAGAKPSPKPQE